MPSSHRRSGSAEVQVHGQGCLLPALAVQRKLHIPPTLQLSCQVANSPGCWRSHQCRLTLHRPRKPHSVNGVGLDVVCSLYTRGFSQAQRGSSNWVLPGLTRQGVYQTAASCTARRYRNQLRRLFKNSFNNPTSNLLSSSHSPQCRYDMS